METQQNQPSVNKNMYIIGGIIAVTIIAIISFVMVRGNKQEKTESMTTPTQKKEEVIPTVDSSVSVEVKAHAGKKKFDLIIRGIPESTTSLDYEITYQTAKGGLPGYSSSVDIKPNQDTYEKDDFLLGTCSTGGTCTYDEVVGPLKVNIKFTGSYGEKLFEKDLEL